METIKINFSDFWDSFDKENNFFLNIIRKKYNVIISDKPDFLIYSVFGMEYLKYDCIRVFYSAENFSPNFNQCDYAMGFDWIEFDKRYLRLPYYYVRNLSTTYKQCIKNKQYSITDLEDRKFCNFIYSNASADTRRTNFFESLSEYKFIHSGGKYLNNIGGRISNKYEYQKQFKFSIAFENSSADGYTTEKIIEAKVAGTVPIYWGNNLIKNEMNPDAFINCHDYNNFEEVINHIKEIDSNDDEFLKILNEPLFNDNIYNINDEVILSFLDNIFKSKQNYRKNHFKASSEKKYRQYYYFEKLKSLFRW